MSRRAPRCEHGMLRGMCIVRSCPHWDGLREWRELTVGGRGRRYVTIEDPEAPHGRRRKLIGP